MEKNDTLKIECPGYKKSGETVEGISRDPVTAIIMRIGDTLRVQCPSIDGKNGRCTASGRESQTKCPYVFRGR
jgi:hypothetical protein